MTRNVIHQHEQWMLDQSASGGQYCRACGASVSVDTQWLGEDDVKIYGHTNPWLRDRDGVDVDLMELIQEGRGRYIDEDDPDWCDQCGMLPGVIGAMDSNDGIQCCDQCRRYDSDLVAARVLGEYLTEILPERAPFTVWFEKAA